MLWTEVRRIRRSSNTSDSQWLIVFPQSCQHICMCTDWSCSSSCLVVLLLLLLLRLLLAMHMILLLLVMHMLTQLLVMLRLLGKLMSRIWKDWHGTKPSAYLPGKAYISAS